MEDIKPLIETLWKLTEAGADYLSDKEADVVFDRHKKERFEQRFSDMYFHIKRDYMDYATTCLDRHKIAAIYIIAFLEAGLIRSKSNEERFIGAYSLALDCALSYMLKELNKQRKAKGKEEINEYFFPEAIFCKTSYYKIMYRNLYYTDKDKEWKLNPLELSERLFLIEYITLREHGIEVKDIREY